MTYQPSSDPIDDIHASVSAFLTHKQYEISMKKLEFSCMTWIFCKRHLISETWKFCITCLVCLNSTKFPWQPKKGTGLSAESHHCGSWRRNLQGKLCQEESCAPYILNLHSMVRLIHSNNAIFPGGVSGESGHHIVSRERQRGGVEWRGGREGEKKFTSENVCPWHIWKYLRSL